MNCQTASSLLLCAANLHPARRLLLNCVGPFRHWGEAVFAACAAAGTDYLDIAGEPGGCVGACGCVWGCVGPGGRGDASTLGWVELLWYGKFRSCVCQGRELQPLGNASL